MLLKRTVVKEKRLRKVVLNREDEH